LAEIPDVPLPSAGAPNPSTHLQFEFTDISLHKDVIGILQYAVTSSLGVVDSGRVFKMLHEFIQEFMCLPPKILEHSASLYLTKEKAIPKVNTCILAHDNQIIDSFLFNLVFSL
jgi:hypothetical protein